VGGAAGQVLLPCRFSQASRRARPHQPVGNNDKSPRAHLRQKRNVMSVAKIGFCLKFGLLIRNKGASAMRDLVKATPLALPLSSVFFSPFFWLLGYNMNSFKTECLHQPSLNS